MPPEIVSQLIGLIPSAIWFLLVLILVLVFYKPIRHDLLPRLGGLRLMGVEMTFAREELEQALEESRKSEKPVSEKEQSQLLRRAQRAAPALQGAQILWVDDHPEFNLSERRLLRSLGIYVDLARSTGEALPLLRQTDYDAVISDMERDGDTQAGLDLLQDMVAHGLHRPTMFYVAHFDPARGVPGHAFGITNRPDHLLHYVMDVLERTRS
ncbi:MAG: response regulator [Chloroflexia bacterium]|nr:response regulator [Chloroflexia bacterium]